MSGDGRYNVESSYIVATPGLKRTRVHLRGEWWSELRERVHIDVVAVARSLFKTNYRETNQYVAHPASEPQEATPKSTEWRANNV